MQPLSTTVIIVIVHVALYHVIVVANHIDHNNKQWHHEWKPLFTSVIVITVTGHSDQMVEGKSAVSGGYSDHSLDSHAQAA